MASSHQQRIATLVALVAQMTELDQLRERVRKATPSRGSGQTSKRRHRLPMTDSLRMHDGPSRPAPGSS